MKLVIAQTAGFCMGVDRALRKLDRAVANPPASGVIRTLGPIIHNPQVLQRYQNLGVCQTNEQTPLTPGDVVVIRAHGIPRHIQTDMENQGITIINATCPKVQKAQILIQKQAREGKHLLLFGEREHPEVRGLVSYAPQHTVFESLEELCALRLAVEQTYFLAAQTTQDREAFTQIHAWAQAHIDPLIVALDTICAATKDRQEEVRSLAHQVQAMIIVGGKNSGNTRRLAQIARECDVFTTHVETAEELPLAELAAFDRIGLTAGASTPAWIIDAVAQRLKEALA